MFSNSITALLADNVLNAETKVIEHPDEFLKLFNNTNICQKHSHSNSSINSMLSK